MKALLFLSGSFAALSLSAQVTVPPAAVTTPSSPITAPTGTPNIAAQPGALLNPAVPTAVAPQTAGRTFQTPFFGGLPAPVTVQTPATAAPLLGVPPVVAPGTVSITGPTNLAGPFSTNVGGFAGADAVGLNFATPFTNAAPPIVNPAAEPVVVDLPPGSVVGTTRTPLPNTVGTPLTPGINRPFPNTPGAVGNAPVGQRGAADSRPPAVVRPQR